MSDTETVPKYLFDECIRQRNDLRASLASLRNAVLEEAAKEAEKTSLNWSANNDAKDGALVAAQDIRKLKS